MAEKCITPKALVNDFYNAYIGRALIPLAGIL